MQLISAATEHARDARCADRLGALPHTLCWSGLKRSDDVVGRCRNRDVSPAPRFAAVKGPRGRRVEGEVWWVEIRGLAHGLSRMRRRTARDLDLLIPSRAPGSAPGTMTCSRERRGRLFYGNRLASLDFKLPTCCWLVRCVACHTMREDSTGCSHCEWEMRKWLAR
jgi:hypothetical protein